MSLFSRFPSLSAIVTGANQTFKRFPYTLASGFFGTIVAIYLNETDAVDPPAVASKLLLIAVLGLPLFTALSTFAERQRWPSGAKRLFPFIGVVLLLAYYVTLPDHIEHPHSHLMRFFLLALGLHFLVAFLPYLGRGQVNGYWQYNKSLFYSILTAVVFSQVMFGGLALALASVDQLFGLEVDSDLYFDLFAVMAGIFNTWLFLGRIPHDLEALNREEDYPHGLKIFTQHILLPLVALYFAILIVYEAKILITWNWPKGWVSQLVLWFSVVGILSLLLLYPLQKRAENRWIARFGKWFFRALIPLVVMLYLAIWQRIADYGITVNRYLVVAMAVGLTVVVLYMVFSRTRDIRFIPVVLCLLAFGSAFGPQSAFHVSERSQKARLETYLLAHGIYRDGAIEKTSERLPYEDRREMSSIISYLAEWHGAGAFSDWFSPDLVAAWEEHKNAYGWRGDVADSLGFGYVDAWRFRGDAEWFSLNGESAGSVAMDVTGYAYFVNYTYSGGTDTVKTYPVATENIYVVFRQEQSVLAVSLIDSVTDAGAATVDLRTPVSALLAEGHRGQMADSLLTFDFSGATVRARLVVSNLSGKIEAEVPTIHSLQGWLLIAYP